jgi:N-acetylmuramoyl-L-alanine amidase
MIAFAEYLLKVVLCSAIFTGYYWIALRNKLFHEWNRFYLLTAVLVSLTLPFVKITVFNSKEQKSEPVYEVIKTITTDERWFEPSTEFATSVTQSFLTAETISIALYLLISFIALLTLLITVFKISRLYRQYNKWKIQNIVFVDTDAKGTPFSFLNYIFWNSSIDLHSTHGQQIFAHEMVHVKQKHSWDKLLMSIVMIVFWSNPFFWLIKKELSMIHEFIADRKSLKDGDTAAFAAMILAAAFPGYIMPFTNAFFYSPVKRRLLMITKLNNPKVGYISRLLLLPLLIVLFVAFAVKTKTITNDSITKFTKPFTVVIDAGHGYQNNGSLHGGKGVNGVTEDDICLSIAKKFEQLNKDENLKLIFTRTDKNFIENKDRIKKTENSNADLLISIHANLAPKIKQGNSYIENPTNGFELYTPTSEHLLFNESVSLGSAIINEMKNIIMIREPGIKQRKTGVYILTASPCPAVLLECGFISNTRDAAFLNDEKNQEKIAEAVLKAIEKYANNQQQKPIIQKDSLPEITKGGLITSGPDDYLILIDSLVIIRGADYQASIPLIIMNGKPATLKQLKGKTYKVKFAEFYPANDPETVKKFGNGTIGGAQVLYGATEIERPASLKQTMKMNEMESTVFVKAEKEPVFPGGEAGWNLYIQSKLNQEPSLKNDETCEVEFIVSSDGIIKDAKIISAPASRIAQICIDAVVNGPKWKPASQNGREVNFMMRKKITFKL